MNLFTFKYYLGNDIFRKNYTFVGLNIMIFKKFEFEKKKKL